MVKIIPILSFIIFLIVWFVNGKFIRSLIITGVSCFLAVIIVGITTKKLNELFPLIPVIIVTNYSKWTDLVLIFVELPIAFYLAKIFRNTIPAYFAITGVEDGYEIMSILYPEILVHTKTIKRAYSYESEVVEETREPKFNEATLNLWEEGCLEKGWDLYEKQVLDIRAGGIANTEDYTKGDTLKSLKGFRSY